MRLKFNENKAMYTALSLILVVSACSRLLVANVEKPQVVDFEKLSQQWQTDDDSVRMFHFWATWCGPCVEELPIYLRLPDSLRNEKFSMVLVSMDFPDRIDKDLVPFLKKRKIGGKVLVLDDPDANTWINSVDTTWSGALPATLVVKNGKKSFIEGPANQKTINDLLHPYFSEP
ncbi:hypothetical protein FUAX_05770 [Fulvitalea axinellae]|uniref:Thioredoxin domain-containing protein n=1 Tax=Fulvitalea axinellae TaxID=1182444 RepID=A0AAU9D7J5_9BACT|nr:hypothetical protein FUAX_05770 [Fulvitalea axinellae]